MLLAKTLTSSTFKLALIAIGTFGVIVSAIFGYVYLSTSAYVRSRSDRAIMAEYASLQRAYERSGRDGLIDVIRQRIADKAFAGHVYVLADPSSDRARRQPRRNGRRRPWPRSGWTEFRTCRERRRTRPSRPLVRAMIDTLPDGDRLLVGRDIGDLDGFTGQIKTAVISGVVVDLRAGRRSRASW